MFPLLYKYLMLHDEVCIHGVGKFFKERNPARHDFLNKVFQPPVYSISFREEPTKADKQFYQFIGKEQGIDEVEAIRRYHDFAFRFNDHVRHYSVTELPGIGVIRKSSDGKLLFTAEELLHSYYVATPAERIVRADAPHTLLVGDNETTSADMQVYLEDGSATERKSKWWIWAVVIGVVAIAAIVYYFLQNGNVRL